jgi:hypothetical protein
MKRANDQEPTEFTEADYDFSSVKAGVDLQACDIYEYARESRAVIKEITSVRKQQLKSGGKSIQLKFGPKVQNPIHSHILMFLSFTTGFPQTPWRGLSDKDLGLMLRMIGSLPYISRYALTWNNPPLTFDLNEAGATTLDSWRKRCKERLPSLPDSDPIKSGFFAVNMKYPRSVLIEEFTNYLRHFEGKAMLEFPPAEKKNAKVKPPGRKSIHDALNALAAMRLRYNCDTFAEARAKMQALKDKPRGMFYERRDNANRACDLALRHFQLLFGWLDSAKPIHFTEGWRGGRRNEKFISAPTQK